eukprot:scaffold85772_cov61-Attheya_sp.AAC.3
MLNAEEGWGMMWECCDGECSMLLLMLLRSINFFLLNYNRHIGTVMNGWWKMQQWNQISDSWNRKGGLAI